MRTIGQFITSDPQQLATQLGTLEQNVVKETQDIRASFDETGTQTPWVNTSGGVFTVGQTVLANTVPGALTGNLAAPKDGKPGWLTVVVNSANALTLTTVGAAKIQTGTAAAFTLGMFRIYFDGTDFWH